MQDKDFLPVKITIEIPHPDQFHKIKLFAASESFTWELECFYLLIFVY